MQADAILCGRKLRPVLFPTLVLLGAMLPAQMSGSYTIDSGGSGSRNFKSFNEASLALYQNGVSGPVTLTVANGYYRESWPVGPVTGASATNKVTFQSQTKYGAVLESSHQPGHVLTFVLGTSQTPVRWIVLDGFRFTAAQASGILGDGHTTDIEIKNCRFDNAIAASPLHVVDGARWNIHHNEFFLRDRSGYVQLTCKDASVHHNYMVVSNNARGFYFGGPDDNGSRVYNNIVVGTMGSTSWDGALACLVGVHNIEFTHNTVAISSNGAGCLVVDGQFLKPTKVHSNILVNLGNGGPALTLRRSNNPYHLSIDGNLYQGHLTIVGGNSYQTMAQWQQATGWDKNSIQADPQFVGPGSIPEHWKLKPTSPAFAKAVNTPAYVTDDFFGTPRAKPATIGAAAGTAPSTFTRFGTGCAGAGGRVPSVGMSGNLALGSRDFTVTLANAKGGLGSAFFAVGVNTANIKYGFWCTLLVTPMLVLRTAVSGPAGAGNGTSSLKLPIPSNPKLKGVTIHCQWGVVDPAATGIGIAFSDGATIKL